LVFEHETTNEREVVNVGMKTQAFSLRFFFTLGQVTVPFTYTRSCKYFGLLGIDFKNFPENTNHKKVPFRHNCCVWDYISATKLL